MELCRVEVLSLSRVSNYPPISFGSGHPVTSVTSVHLGQCFADFARAALNGVVASRLRSDLTLTIRLHEQVHI